MVHFLLCVFIGKYIAYPALECAFALHFLRYERAQPCAVSVERTVSRSLWPSDYHIAGGDSDRLGVTAAPR